MAIKSQQQMLDRYSRGIQNAGQDYTAGVQATQADWAGRLQAAKPRMQAGFNAAMQDGRFDNSVQNLGTAGWKQRTVAKAANYANASTRAIEGYSRVVGEMHAVLTEVNATVTQMPANTEAEREQRALQNMRLMRERWAARR